MSTTIRSLIPANLNIANLLKKETPVQYTPNDLFKDTGFTPILDMEADRGLDSFPQFQETPNNVPVKVNPDWVKYEQRAQNQNQNMDLKSAITPFNPAFYNLYNQFLTTTLNKFSGISLNDIWLIDIDFQDVCANVSKVLNAYEKGLFIYDLKEMNKYSFNGKHLLLAQGVSVVGDSGTLNRVGTTNTGYIQGVVGMGRTPFNTLDVKILENNTSFVDYVLRPWMVAVSHASLKESKLKANITMIALTRIGGNGGTGGFGKTATGNGFVPRKIFTYSDCVPMDVDNMEYNYTQDTSPTLRTVKFGFKTYTMDTIKNGEGTLFESIMRTENQLGDITGRFLTRTNNETDMVRTINYADAIMNGLAETTLSPAGVIKGPTKNKAGIMDKFTAMLDSKLKGYETQAIGMVQTAINNTLGAVDGTTLSWIVKGEQTVTKPLNTAIEGLNVAVTSTLEKLNPNGRNDDATHHVQNGVGRELGNPSYTNTNIATPKNDTPNISTVGSDPNLPYKPVFTDSKDAIGINGIKPNALLSYIVRPNPPINDVRHGEIIVGGKSIDQNDRPDGLHDLQNILPNPDSNDHLTGKEQVGNVKPNPTKVTEPSKTIKFVYIPTPANDVLRSK